MTLSTASPRPTAIAVVLACCVLLAASTPVAAATDSEDGRASKQAEGEWWLRTDPVVIRRDGVRYRMSIEARESVWYEYDDELDEYRGPYRSEAVRVKLQAVDDPAGIAKTVETLSVAYGGLPQEDSFVYRPNLASARLDTGKALGPDGAISLRFDATSPLQRDCATYGQRRTGTVSASLDYTPPDSSVGAITKAPTTATLVEQSQGCAPTESIPCRGNHTRIELGREWVRTRRGWQWWHLDAVENDGANTASVKVTWNAYDDTFGRHEDAASARRTTREMRTTLPHARVTVSKDQSNATISGLAGTPLTGKGHGTFPQPRVDKRRCM